MGQRRDKAVVIGAGIGGLSAAIRLAAAGMEVTVCETQAYPGGKMRALPSVAGPVDAGPTVLTMRSVFDALFEAAGTRLDAHLTLHRETILARHWWPDGSTLDLFADPERSAAAVREFAGPAEEAAFRAFSAQCATLFDCFDASMMRAADPKIWQLGLSALRSPSSLSALRPGACLAGLLKRRFKDPRLRQLFGRYATYVGGSPYASPAVLALIWHAEAQGVWRVEGGMHNLAHCLASLAESLGATLRFNCPVDKILSQRGQVQAVQLAEGAQLDADWVVFNGDPRALATGLLGEDYKTALPKAATTPRSLSANVWAFAAQAEGRDLVHHNVFFGPDPQDEFAPLTQGRPAKSPALYVCAQDRGTGQAPPQIERFEIIMNAPPLGVGQPEDPETCRRRTFQALRAHGLQFSREPGLSRLTTPPQFDALFPASLGSLYGRSPHGMMAALARPRTRSKVPGLYLVGGGVHPGAGVPMAALCGQHAAETILKDRTSTSTSRRMAMPGGTWMRSRKTGSAPSR